MLTGKQIWSLRMIEWGVPEKVDDGIVPSFGLDSMLYTFRMQTEDWRMYMLQPLEFILLKTYETVRMPLDCGGMLTLKSTYSRQGCILTTNSPVDPGYYGKLSIGIFNSSATPVFLDSRGGFMQMTVHAMSEDTEAYAGRWQNGG